jgi:hypothetical protein
LTISETHPPLGTQAKSWLGWLSDPAPTRAPPAHGCTADDLLALLVAAEHHAVLATCLANLKTAAAAACGAGARRGEILEQKAARAVERLSVQMLLAHHANEVKSVLQDKGLPFIVVKGQSFADRLYPSPRLRGYTDVDLLVPVSSRVAIGEVLSSLGFVCEEMDYRKGSDYFEDKWILRAHQDVLIEVHGDLVHNPRLRAQFSLRYDDVLAAGRGDSRDATALLLVAGTHGAASHQFDRLQHVVDVLQCARGAAGPVDVAHLRAICDTRGLTLAVAAAVDLASRMYDDAACRALLRAFAPARFERVASRLLTRDVVLDAQSDRRSKLSWRRKLFRQAMRAGSGKTAAG